MASIPPFVVIAFELTILFGGVATLIGMVTLGRLPRFSHTAAYDPRFSSDRFGVAVHCAPDRGASVRQILQTAGRGRDQGDGMKYVFLLVLLLVGAVAAGMGGVVALALGRQHDADAARSCPASACSRCPRASSPRGGTLILPREQRELAAKQPNPVKTVDGVHRGRQGALRDVLRCRAMAPRQRAA